MRGRDRRGGIATPGARVASVMKLRPLSGRSTTFRVDHLPEAGGLAAQERRVGRRPSPVLSRRAPAADRGAPSHRWPRLRPHDAAAGIRSTRFEPVLAWRQVGACSLRTRPSRRRAAGWSLRDDGDGDAGKRRLLPDPRRSRSTRRRRSGPRAGTTSSRQRSQTAMPDRDVQRRFTRINAPPMKRKHFILSRDAMQIDLKRLKKRLMREASPESRRGRPMHRREQVDRHRLDEGVEADGQRRSRSRTDRVARHLRQQPHAADGNLHDDLIDAGSRRGSPRRLPGRTLCRLRPFGGARREDDLARRDSHPNLVADARCAGRARAGCRRRTSARPAHGRDRHE